MHIIKESKSIWETVCSPVVRFQQATSRGCPLAFLIKAPPAAHAGVSSASLPPSLSPSAPLKPTVSGCWTRHFWFLTQHTTCLFRLCTVRNWFWELKWTTLSHLNTANGGQRARRNIMLPVAENFCVDFRFVVLRKYAELKAAWRLPSPLLALAVWNWGPLPGQLV